jgi:hypothetical protein
MLADHGFFYDNQIFGSSLNPALITMHAIAQTDGQNPVNQELG